jgi:hypothetical protein
MNSATSSRSFLSSGIRITSAPPATPAWRAIHPACLPITSTTMIRRWASAVEWSDSIAVAADDDDPVEPPVPVVAHGRVHLLDRVPAVRSPDDGPTAGEDAGDVVEG